MKNYILPALDYILNWVLSWSFAVYDRLFGIPYALLPYFWVKVALGIATGLFIPRVIIGLATCVLGNVAIFAYTAFVSWHPGSFSSLITVLQSREAGITLFGAGVVWWIVGRIMRWACYKIRGHTHADTIAN